MAGSANKGPGRMRLRNYFLTGFIICAPLAITAYLVWSFVQWVDSWVKPYIPQVYNPDNYLPFTVPGFGLIVAIVLITMIGFLTANFIGRTVVSLGERILGRMPLVRNIYSGLKQILETVLSDKTNKFTQVGLIEYPRKGLWAIIFIATEAEGEVLHEMEAAGAVKPIAVFLPTTPNPTSGFLLMVPRDEITLLSMSVEEAAKLVISAGLVTPEFQKRVAALREQADGDHPDHPIAYDKSA
jgi:uncharacterized membrane protein